MAAAPVAASAAPPSQPRDRPAPSVRPRVAFAAAAPPPRQHMKDVREPGKDDAAASRAGGDGNSGNASLKRMDEDDAAGLHAGDVAAVSAAAADAPQRGAANARPKEGNKPESLAQRLWRQAQAEQDGMDEEAELQAAAAPTVVHMDEEKHEADKVSEVDVDARPVCRAEHRFPCKPPIGYQLVRGMPPAYDIFRGLHYLRNWGVRKLDAICAALLTR